MTGSEHVQNYPDKFRGFFYHMGACRELTWKTRGTRICHEKKASWSRQCDAFGNVLLESLGPAINADITLTHTNFLCNIADHVLHLMEQVAWWIVSPIQEWLRNVWWSTITSFRCYVTSKFSRSQSSQTFVGCAGQGLSIEAPTWQYTTLKRSTVTCLCQIPQHTRGLVQHMPKQDQHSIKQVIKIQLTVYKFILSVNFVYKWSL